MLQRIFTDSPKTYRESMFDLIADIVAGYYKVDASVMRKLSQKKEVVTVRHHIIYFCLKNIPNTGYSELGNYFGYDHATIIYIEKKIKGYLEVDRQLKLQFDDIQRMINVKIENMNDLSELKKSHYFVDMNDCISVKHKEKAIIFVGYTKEQLKKVTLMEDSRIIDMSDLRSHQNTKMYILEKKKDGNNN